MERHSTGQGVGERLFPSAAGARTRAVLSELRVENLLLIERATLRLAPGLNVLTGETGAGKTMLAHALDLLLGGRARSAIVRPGAAEAYVEGVFELGDELRGWLGDRIAADAEELVLARRVGAEGRSRAYLNGRSVTVGDLRELAERLIAFYGQHEHRRLMLASSQLEILDAACGAGHAERLAAAATAHAQVRACEARLAELRELQGARERELDLVAFELAEIDDAAPSTAEEAQLVALRDRLRHIDVLRGASLGAAEAISSADGGAAEALAAGAGVLTPAQQLDPALDALIDRWHTVMIEASDLAAELRSYGESLEGAPGELEQAEERLAVLDRLKRKHGGSIEAVLEHQERCRRRREELEGAEVAMEATAHELDRALAERASLAAGLRDARRAAAAGLEQTVRERLAELAMEAAGFEIAFAEREPGPSGSDAVEFLIAPNAGVPAAPLREIASGGELSRVMLALLGAVNGTTGAVLVFDEIDAGIGGHTARAVGEQLRGLAAGRQLVCITHLAQVASLADRHFAIVKDSSSDPVRTVVEQLPERAVVGELMRMLGADEDDDGAREHALGLRRVAVA